MRQLKLISTGTVLLLLFLTTFLISGASAAGPALNLPTFQVQATFELTGSWPNLLTLSGVGSGYDVQDNVSYNFWCVERVTSTPPVGGTPYYITLHSSYDPNLPTSLKMYGSRVIPWDQINWVLNNKGSYSGNTIQNAIWSLVEGQDTGSGDINVPVLVNAAMTNGTGFVPEPGQIIAVIVAKPPDGISTSSDNWQETIFEVTVPEPVPGISIVKYTNGQLANDPNGSDVPEIKPGDPVTWTYVVTNTGQVPIAMADVSVTDDQTGVSPVFDHVKTGNADAIFDHGEVWVYVASGVAVDLSTPPAGVTVVQEACIHGETEPARTAYVNQGTASIPGATSTAQSSYCNPPAPGISIVKYTNGQLANDPNGSDVPVIAPGDPVTWTYVVTNTGQVAIAMADVNVTDNQTGVTPAFDHVKTGNADEIFDPGEVWVYVASGVAVNLNNPPAGVTVVPGVCTHGQTQPPRNAYVNQGTASIPGETSTAQSSYCNPPAPGISIVKYTNGQVANDPDGADVPVIKPGDPVTWTYVVTNTGQVPIAKADVSVTDDQTGVTPAFDHVKTGNTDAIFDPGEVWVYVASGVAVDLSTPPNGVTVIPGVCTHGQTQPPRTAYVNQGTASIPGASSTAQSSYCNPLVPGISILKYTNGQVANDPNGADVPVIAPGDPVTWTYVVTNTGQVTVARANVSVTDDQTGVTPVFDHVKTGNVDGIFDPGEVWVYVASGVAVDLSTPPTGVTVIPGVCTHGQTQPPRTAYVNQGTASIPGATSNAQSSYCNPPAPGISIVKYTNGQLASDPDGADVPLIAPGDPVTWTYVVTNTGNVPVPAASVSITDDQTGVTPVFDHVKTGNTDAVFDPGEVWVYVASGVAVNLNTPPTDVTVVQGVCTHNQTQLPRNAYVNQGTASIPGATSTAQSSYCNPLFKVYFPLQNGKPAFIPQGWHVAVGYEDLPLAGGGNDYDYNDWITDIDGVATFDLRANNGLSEMVFKVSPHARGATYDHTFHIAITHGTFGSDGTAVLTIFDQNHQVISSQSSAFKASEDNDFIIFPDTSAVFPDLSNTYESKPYVPPQRYATLDITFTSPAPFDLSSYNLSLPHGGGLFFDPYLYVHNTGDTIYSGDIRMLAVPDTKYLWPEEKIRIDKAFPDVTFVPGNPPTITFPGNWWLTYNHCVYDGVPCTLSRAPSVGTVIPGTPTVTPP
jgi:LruC domain-containing protein